jgi:hypothetical protein
VAVDLLKDNLGEGAAFLLYPFSTRGTELGLVDPENVIFFLPFDAALLLGAWILRRKVRRVRE